MTKTTLRSATLVAAVAAALPLGALAQQAQPGQPAQPATSTPEVAFMRADANSDGKLSKAEAAKMPALAAKFETLDKDKDGMLSMGEYMTAFDAPAPKQ